MLDEEMVEEAIRIDEEIAAEAKKQCLKELRQAYIKGAREFTIVRYSDKVLEGYAEREYPE
jgi:hypothetical protein